MSETKKQRGRPPKQALQTAVEFNEQAFAVGNSEQDQIAAIDRAALAQSKQYADMFRQTGRAEAFDLMARLTRISSIILWKQIKESKQFKGLPYTDSSGESRRVGNFGEYCEHFLGMSQSVVDDLIQNASAFSEEALQGQARLQISDRTMRKLRGLPESEAKAEIVKKLEVAHGDAESIRAAVDELEQTVAAELDTLREQVTTLKANETAHLQLLEAEKQKVETARATLDRLSFGPGRFDEQNQRLMEGITAAAEKLAAALVVFSQFPESIATHQYPDAEPVEEFRLRSQVFNHYATQWQALVETGIAAVQARFSQVQDACQFERFKVADHLQPTPPVEAEPDDAVVVQRTDETPAAPPQPELPPPPAQNVVALGKGRRK